jgi:ADP-L-glycero-D-manno-heptose 6-epimerase
MIVVTGAAGFIGSCLVSKLNNKGHKDIVLVDDFSRQEKQLNYMHKVYRELVERKLFFDWFRKNHSNVDFILHIGARTDTTEFNKSVFDELNLGYSQQVWNACTEYGIPLIYASSAATYGDGSLGYDDDPAIIPDLAPLNPYGVSKNDFDKWVLQQPSAPPFWAGLKFFNVFGPNEYHKGRMASVIFHAFRQLTNPPQGTTLPASVRLFRSHNPGYPDGGQLRDFIYVKDVADVIWFLMNHQANSGIYNLGTGKARSFSDLATAVFTAMDRPVNIEFIDTPVDIRDKYQYFTQAKMARIRSLGYERPFFTLEDGIEEYVQGYLIPGNYC